MLLLLDCGSLPELPLDIQHAFYVQYCTFFSLLLYNDFHSSVCSCNDLTPKVEPRTRLFHMICDHNSTTSSVYTHKSKIMSFRSSSSSGSNGSSTDTPMRANLDENCPRVKSSYKTRTSRNPMSYIFGKSKSKNIRQRTRDTPIAGKEGMDSLDSLTSIISALTLDEGLPSVPEEADAGTKFACPDSKKRLDAAPRFPKRKTSMGY